MSDIPAAGAGSSPLRIGTGVPGLDTVLSGGLLPGGVYIVQGTPGAGKTILANQICFHRARQGDKALYVTLLAESHSGLMQHLQRMSFYDSQYVPASIFYLSGYDDLESDGLEGILRLINRESQVRGASLIIIDGVFVLGERAHSEREFRKFVNYLSNLASLLKATILMLTNSKRSQASPEYTMVDGWLELAISTEAYRSRRHVQVHKFRGSGFISGLHAMDISADGMRVLPRLEMAEGMGADAVDLGRRTSSGLKEVDALLGGGVPVGSTTLLLGPTGIGKTTFGLHFIAQCSEQAPGLIFGFYETQRRLELKAATLGLDLADLIRRGIVEVLWQPPTEHALDALGYRLLDAVRRRGVKRVFVDGIRGIEQSAAFAERIPSFLAALTKALRDEGVTSFYSAEVPQMLGRHSEIAFGHISAVAENIVLLRYVELESKLRRLFSLLKVREGDFDTAIREFEITNQGVRMGTIVRRAEDLLTGHAHRQPPADA